MRRPRHHRDGFTLLEVMLVLGVIAMFLAMTCHPCCEYTANSSSLDRRNEFARGLPPRRLAQLKPVCRINFVARRTADILSLPI